MQTRQNLLDIFSSFVQFEGDRFGRWMSDARLRRSMQPHCQSVDDADELAQFWALYWHKEWQRQSQGIAQDHLLAYLQESCYWVAHKTGKLFPNTQYGIADCFQLAIAQFDKILSGFNSEQGFNLNKYASAAFSSLIRDHLRQRREIDISTDWSLLRKVSQSRLFKALRQHGLGEDDLQRYCLAWQSYKQMYVPSQSTSTRRLTAPDPATWEAIVAHFNHERLGLSPNEPTVSVPQMTNWLAVTAKAIRSYLYPTTVSVNTTIGGDESSEFIDSLTETDRTTPLADLISEEEQTQRRVRQTQLSAVLDEAIGQLESEAQSLLRLYYSDGATQKQIAAQLGIKQYAISRRLSRIKKALLKKLTQWGQETLHITPAPDVLKHTSAALEEWLKTHYGS